MESLHCISGRDELNDRVHDFATVLEREWLCIGTVIGCAVPAPHSTSRATPAFQAHSLILGHPVASAIFLSTPGKHTASAQLSWAAVVHPETAFASVAKHLKQGKVGEQWKLGCPFCMNLRHVHRVFMSEHKLGERLHAGSQLVEL